MGRSRIGAPSYSDLYQGLVFLVEECGRSPFRGAVFGEVAELVPGAFDAVQRRIQTAGSPPVLANVAASERPFGMSFVMYAELVPRVSPLRVGQPSRKSSRSSALSNSVIVLKLKRERHHIAVEIDDDAHNCPCRL